MNDFRFDVVYYAGKTWGGVNLGLSLTPYLASGYVTKYEELADELKALVKQVFAETEEE